MEPVSLLGTFAARAAGGIAASVLGKMMLTKRWAHRVGRKALKPMKKPRPRRELVKWLQEPSTWDLLVSPHHPGAAAAQDLNRVFSTETSKRMRDQWLSLTAKEQESRVNSILVSVYDLVLTEHEHRWSNRVASERNLSATKEVASQLQAVTSGLQGAGLEALELHLSRLPAGTHGLFRRSWETSPSSTLMAVRLLTDKEARPASTLNQWSQDAPTWLHDEASPLLFDALGECAYTYGQTKFAVFAFTEAILRGATNASYLRARVSYLRKYADIPGDSVVSLTDSVAPTEGFERFVYYVVREERSEACSTIAQLQPIREIDVLIKALHLLECHFFELSNWSEEALNTGIEILSEALEEARLAGLLLKRSELFRVRAANFPRNSYANDTRAALVDAIAAREIRRSIRGDSAEAVTHLYDVAIQLGQPGRVVAGFRQSDAEFACTFFESQSEAVREKVAMAAFGIADDELLLDLASRMNSGFVKSRLLAYSAEIAGDPDIEEKWLQALSQARDEVERVQALSALARLGAAELPGLDILVTQHPGTATELRATWEIARGNFSSAIEALRPIRRSSYMAAHHLANAYEKAGRHNDSAQTLFDASIDFHDHSLSHQGCLVLARGGLMDAAREGIRRHLEACPPAWEGYAESLALAAQIYIESQDLESAAPYLRAYIELAPEDFSRTTLYLRLLTRIGDHTKAIELFRERHAELSISDSNDAHLWLTVAQWANHPVEDVASKGLQFLDRFGRAEGLWANVLVATLTASQQDEIPDAMRDRIQREIAEFTSRWPASNYLRMISLDLTKNVADQLTSLTKRNDEIRALQSMLFGHVSRAQLPLGAATAIGTMSHAEALARRYGDALAANSLTPGDESRCEQTVSEFVDKDVTLDLSALVSVSHLPEKIRAKAFSHFRRILISRISTEETRAALESQSSTSGSLYFDPYHSSARLMEYSEDEKSRVTGELRAMLNLCSELHVLPRPDLRVANELGNLRDESWLADADLAADRETALWCDDSAMRAQLRIMGISSFSTFSVLRYLHKRGSLNEEERSGCIEILFAAKIGDIDFSSGFALAHLERTAWDTGAVTAALRRGAQWHGRPETFRVFYELLKEARTRADQASVDIVAAAAVGASNACYVQSDAIASVTGILAFAVLNVRPALIPDIYHSCNEATIRPWIDTSDEHDLEGDRLLSETVKLLIEAVREFVPAETVPSFITGLFSGLAEEDRQVVARTLILAD
ncbi:hypothetical protein ACGFKX_12450 [Pseudonocardia alni]|uniref:PIN domain-containing protein n=1 Tax=Pseudonocardia alni TaxID=33907 RepID=UPI003716894E